MEFRIIESSHAAISEKAAQIKISFIPGSKGVIFGKSHLFEIRFMFKDLFCHALLIEDRKKVIGLCRQYLTSQMSLIGELWSINTSSQTVF